MNGETFVGAILAGYGSWMFMVFSELFTILLAAVFLVVAVIGVIGIYDDLFNESRWIKRVFRVRSVS